MLRASDIYGRRPGSVPEKPKVEKKKDEPKSRQWDPATGQFVEEELPAEVQELIRGSKRPKVEDPPQQLRPPHPPPPPAPSALPLQPPVQVGPKRLTVVFRGFLKQDLNSQYMETPDHIQGKVSFWNLTRTYFIYWQQSMGRWAICDSGSCQAAKEGSVPGWAYRNDSEHFAKSNDGWMEVHANTWRPANVTCTVIAGTADDPVKEVANEAPAPRTELTVDQYRVLIKQVYSEKNPSKLPDVPGLFQKYQGREKELFEQVCDKYKASLESLLGGASTATATMPELASREYAILVQAVYQKQNPAKIRDLPKLLESYRGREKDLYTQVCDKYGLHPAKFYKDEGEAMLAEI